MFFAVYKIPCIGVGKGYERTILYILRRILLRSTARFTALPEITTENDTKRAPDAK